MISAQKSSWLVTIARAIPGLAATAPAVTAVTARPATIQPYTARRNAPTCSAAAAGLSAAGDRASGIWVSDTIQPYTARRNAPTCSAAAAGLSAAGDRASGIWVSDSILASPGSKAGRDASRKDGRTEGRKVRSPTFRHSVFPSFRPIVTLAGGDASPPRSPVISTARTTYSPGGTGAPRSERWSQA